ncbi:unnamed protein product [Microthlaspi erraticum]|uniref:Uncharacterized protein n=1 Tax=Microthlaspi erraticum TaxID=1685480 RepID=A0A6D2K0G6_9BRAS|nr:unnamed protein product [Microthlaspi erraticum]
MQGTHASPYKTAYNTRHQREGKLSVGGSSPILVQLESTGQEKVYSSRLDGHQVLQDQPLIEHKELDGRPPVYTLVGHEEDLREEEPELDRAEDRAETTPVNEDLGEPECYYFEEYEAPRMNPSVVAAHKRIGLLQSSTSGKGKPWKRCKSPWTRWRGQHAEKEEEFQRRSNSIESKQRKLNSIELRVELTWRSPCLRTLGFEYDQPVPGLLSDPGLPTTASSEHSSTKAKEATHFEDEEERRKSHKLDRVSRKRQPQLHGVLLMAVSHLQTTT